MGLDDGVRSYKGRLAEFAAECAMEGMRYAHEEDGTKYSTNDAEGEIDAVWEFVRETCRDEGYPVPIKEDAIKQLKKLIKNELN